MSFAAKLLAQPKWLVLVEALILAGLIGWLDYATGWEWTFFIFYAVPIVLVVRRTNQRFGYGFAALCTVIWTAANLADNPYHSKWGFVMAIVTRMFYFGILVVAAAAAKAQRESDLARIQTLERAQELEREILRTSEREQQRIGRDLHDSLGPHLAAIGYAATFLARELRKHEHPESAKADQICGMVGEAVSLTRGLARGLFPVQMENSGLAVALQDLATMTSKLGGLSATFYETGDTSIADPRDAMQLYRIAQEAVNNASKHAAASNVTIVMSKSEDSLTLVVADDGRGITTSQSGTGGIGFHSMKYRARDIGATIELTSIPGEGTTISCILPLYPPDRAPLSP